MTSVTKHTKEFRLKVVEYALENNISEASALFDLNRSTVSRWIKNYKTDGDLSLENKSRIRQAHPDNKISSESEKQIIELKKNDPQITIKDIITRLNLDCSQTIISRILKYNGLSSYKPRDKKNTAQIILQPMEFEHSWEINCNYITTKYIDNKRQYIYNIALRERSSGIEFIGFTYERSSLSISIFVDYIMYNLKNAGIETSDIKIYAPRSSVYSNIKSGKETFLDNILNIKYKAKLSVMKAEDNLLPVKQLSDEISIEEIQTGNGLIRSAFMYILQNNLNAIDSGLISSRQKLRSLFIPPIIVDDFIHDINAIKDFDHYWHSLNQPAVRNKIINDVLINLKQTGDLKKGNYENEKALDLYDKIVSILQYTKSDDKKLKMSVVYKKGEIFQMTGNYPKAIENLGSSLELAEEINDSDTIADSSCMLGDLMRVTQSEKNNERYYNKALTAARSNEGSKIKFYKTLGTIFSRQLNYVLALNYFNSMLEESKKQKDDFNYSSALQLIGETYKNLSLFQVALTYFEKRIDIELDINDKFRLMELYNSLAAVNYELDNYDSALKYYILQLDFSKEIGDKGSEAVAYKKIADINFNIRHDNKSAVNNYFNALNIFEKIDDKVNICMTMILISIVYKKERNFKKAISLLHKVQAIGSSIKNNYVLSCVEGQLGSIYLYQNRPNRALDSFLIQESIARRNNINSLMANSSKFISYIYLTQKRYARSEVYDIEAKKIYSMLNQRYGENELKRDFIHQAEDYQYLTENYS